MQSFLPYADFDESARCLDTKRLGKQRVEAFQVLKALSDPSYGWQRHPAVNQWRGFEDALVAYYAAICREWVRRGYKHTMPVMIPKGDYAQPAWLGNAEYHASHRSNLLRKDAAYYGRYGWHEAADMPYVWPTAS